MFDGDNGCLMEDDECLMEDDGCLIGIMYV